MSNVAPLAGAWIETSCGCHPCTADGVAPRAGVDRNQLNLSPRLRPFVAPLRERGSKHARCGRYRQQSSVAPRAGGVDRNNFQLERTLLNVESAYLSSAKIIRARFCREVRRSFSPMISLQKPWRKRSADATTHGLRRRFALAPRFCQLRI